MPLDSYTEHMQLILRQCPANSIVSKLTWEYNDDSEYNLVKSSAMATAKEAEELIVLLKSYGIENINLRCNGLSLINKEKPYHVDCLPVDVIMAMAILILKTQDNKLLAEAIELLYLTKNKTLINSWRLELSKLVNSNTYNERYTRYLESIRVLIVMSDAEKIKEDKAAASQKLHEEALAKLQTIKQGDTLLTAFHRVAKKQNDSVDAVDAAVKAANAPRPGMTAKEEESPD